MLKYKVFFYYMMHAYMYVLEHYRSNYIVNITVLYK